MRRSPFRVVKHGLLPVLFIGELTRGLDELGSLRAARRPIEQPGERSEADDAQRLFHDFAFTSSLRDSMRAAHESAQDSERKLSTYTCMAEGADCSDSTALCCQGGCSWSQTCFCQPNYGLCFNFGEEDRFCCSNRCGLDGRCECIAEGGSCAAGDYCCGGLNCVGGTCSNETSAPSPEPTANPSASPITSPPVVSVISNVNQLMNDKCQSSGGVCFNRGQTDTFCCSKACGADGRCEAPPPTPPPTSAEPSQSPIGQPSSSPTPRPTHMRLPDFHAKSFGNGQCDDGEVEITIEVETDQFGDDVAWSLFDVEAGRNLHSVDEGTYGLFTRDEVHICTTPGMYNFTVTDKYGDGICCAYGVGFVRVSLSGREVLYVESYGKGLNEILNVGFDPTPLMTERDHLYLEAHNVRRMLWHTANDLDHVPLVWSPTLAEESRVWAEQLLVNCSSSGIEHEKNVAEGENLAKNTGTVKSDGSGWGQLYPPDNILRRWVEFEVKRDYPGNAHLTAALWRASKYMGCGESEKVFRNGMCRVQVCRYARAGNCDMGRYNATVGKNWLGPMLSHTSRCGPNCAPEGCY